MYNILTYLGYNTEISNDSKVIRDASHIILPGVGAFGAAIEKIFNRINFEVLEDEVIQKGKPFLGICVGMQVLANIGKEYGEFKGFSWIPGTVEKINPQYLPLPHIGWNNIEIINDNQLFRDFSEYRDFYFVHSYAFNAINEENVIATTEYEVTFTSAIQKDNVYGIQFHPEKSQKAGQLLLRNFINLS